MRTLVADLEHQQPMRLQVRRRVEHQSAHEIHAIVADAALHLQPQGLLVIEIGHEREHFDAAFAALEAVGLPTSEGDDSVLLITRDALERTP